MSSSDQDFKTFYNEFKVNKDENSNLGQFKSLMSSGQTPLRVNWDKIFYCIIGTALIAKGLYFWKK